MVKEKLIRLGFVTLAIAIIFLFHLSRQPMCIVNDSIEKIYRFEGDREEIMYSCQMHRHSNFSAFFHKHKNYLNEQINQIVPLLTQIAPFKTKVTIAITTLSGPPNSQQDKIYSEEKKLTSNSQNDDYLSRQLIRFWLQQQFRPCNAGDVAVEHAIEEFLYFLRSRNFIEPILIDIKEKDSDVKKLAEDMIKSYLHLDVFQKYVFLKKLPKLLINLSSDACRGVGG